VLYKGRYQVTFDAEVGFTMENTITGATTTFVRDKDGLFSAPLGSEPNKHEVDLLTTVEANKKLYTKRQVERVEAARKLYQVIGFPSIRDYKHLVQNQPSQGLSCHFGGHQHLRKDRWTGYICHEG
jgi:hypothetical protein